MAVQSLKELADILNECDFRAFGRTDNNGKQRVTINAYSPKNDKRYFLDRKAEGEGEEKTWKWVVGKEMRPRTESEVDA